MHYNVSILSNINNAVQCFYPTNFTFQQCNNSHIYHLHLPLFNPNVHIVCIHARKLFSRANLDSGHPILCTTPFQMHFMESRKIRFYCSCISILFMCCYSSNQMTQRHHYTNTFKTRHFGILCQDSQAVHASFNVPLPHSHRL